MSEKRGEDVWLNVVDKSCKASRHELKPGVSPLEGGERTGTKLGAGKYIFQKYSSEFYCGSNI